MTKAYEVTFTNMATGKEVTRLFVAAGPKDAHQQIQKFMGQRKDVKMTIYGFEANVVEEGESLVI